MRAQLKTIYSVDVHSLETWRPEDAECFAVQVRALIGPRGGEGEEVFDFTVCTAAWLGQTPPPKGFDFVRSTILVDHWDYATLTRALGDLCSRTEGKDWNEVATRLSRYGHWEFEDYRG